MSDKVRVNELATQLGLTNKEILVELEKTIGLVVKSHSSIISKEEADKLIASRKVSAPTSISEQRTQRRPVFGSQAPKAPVETAKRAVKLIKKVKPAPVEEAPKEIDSSISQKLPEVPYVKNSEPTLEQKTEPVQVPTVAIEKIETRKTHPQKIVDKVTPRRDEKPQEKKVEVVGEKPKTEGDGAKKAKAGIDDNMKVIIINLVTTVLICVLFLSVSYVLQSSLLDAKLAKVAAPADASASDGSTDDSTGGDGEEVQKGFILDLGDFILNLSDVSPRKYLKVNVALEVSNKPEDAAAEAPAAKGEGGGKEGAAPAENPLDAEMAQFKPAIRDAVITTLSSKTSAELSTVAGKELAKEQISEAVNGIFAGERDVIRVSFGQFIIQ